MKNKNIRNFNKFEKKWKELSKEALLNPIEDVVKKKKNIKSKIKVKKKKHTKEYIDYIGSYKWKKKREELFKIRGKVCERCKSDKLIEVHHNSYETLFNEDLDHLEVLCKSCHRNHHKRK